MKILLCSISSPHELTGIGKYNGELVEWFREKGHLVDMLTTLPYYPYWEIYEGYRDKKYLVEQSDHGAIHSVHLPVSQNVSTTRRVMMDSTFGLKMLHRLPGLARRQKYDIIQLVLPPITAFPSAIAGKRIGSSKLHVHVQDLQLEAADELELLPRPIIKPLQKFEQRCLRSADYITAVSNNMLARIRPKVQEESTRLSVIENWADTEEIKPINDKSWLKKKMGYARDTFLVVCSGNIGEKQRVEQIIPVAEMLSNHNHIQFLILGDGARKQVLVEESENRNLDNIQFADLVPKADLNRMLNGSDVQLVLQKKEAGDSFFPSKYINILSAGIPSVVTANQDTELHKTADENSTSVVVEPENAEMLADAILKLYSDEELISVLAGNARQLALRRYGKDAILNGLERDYLNLLS